MWFRDKLGHHQRGFQAYRSSVALKNMGSHVSIPETQMLCKLTENRVVSRKGVLDGRDGFLCMVRLFMNKA